MNTDRKTIGLPAKIITILLGLLLTAATADASYINLGSLDVRPADTSAGEYLTEFLAPGESARKEIQISNFSGESKELLIYSTETTDTENENYFTRNYGETKKDIGGWIGLPVEKLTLEPAESAIMGIRITAPENAGVGLHTGAVIVRELPPAQTPADSQTSAAPKFSVEKGVRIYLNVTGPVISDASVSQVSYAENGSSYLYGVSVLNNGTVIDKQNFTATLKNLFGETLSQNTVTAETRPGETETSVLEIAKPEFGLYTLSLSAETGESVSKTVLVIPLWTLLSLVLGLLMYASWARKTSFCPYKIAQKLRYANLAAKTASLFKSLEFQRSFAYLGLAAIVFSFALNQINLNPDELKTQLLTTPECSFDLTVKWGGLRDTPYPEGYTQKWQGSIEIPNSRISILEYLHFEHTDQIELNKEKNILYYNLETGPDNDGIIIQVEPVQKEFPHIYYHNDLDRNTVDFVITDHTLSPGVYPNKLGATFFQAELCKDNQLIQELMHLTAMEELVGTPDISATADALSVPAPGAMIPELENLFMEELPASPDVLSDFIMKSNYVQKVSRIDSTRKIETDNILLRALQATPDILEEISATPDLNFIFIPADTIVFPPIAFSFTDEKIIRQPMGTIIFVQNKEDPWNAFIGTTDFQSLAKDLRIPASALTIDPGVPQILGKYKVKGPDEELLLEEPSALEELFPAAEETPPVEETPPATEEPAVETPADATEPSTDGETPIDAETTTDEAPGNSGNTPANGNNGGPSDTGTPTENDTPATDTPTNNDIPSDTDAPTDIDAPTDTDAPIDINAPTDTDTPTPPAFSARDKIDVQIRKLEITPETLEKIKAGEKRSFSGRFDKATLISVDPTPGEKVIFILQPVLEIRIPAGMPAGTYQGELTITSL